VTTEEREVGPSPHLGNSRRTVPRAQARSLRNIDIHHKSFKAVDWMHIILCMGEVLLAGRIPGECYNIFMALCRPCRLLFRPSGLSEAEIKSIDDDITYFVSNYYDTSFGGSVERLPLCLSTISTLLHIAPLLRACGPAWVCWQSPMERKIGTLGNLIRSQSRPHASLEENLTRQCEADLITFFGHQILTQEWAAATGRPPKEGGSTRCGLKILQDIDPSCTLLPPRSAVAYLGGAELVSMRAVLAQEAVHDVPQEILAMKYYRLELASGKTARSRLMGSDCQKHRRRKHLLQINSTEMVRRRGGPLEQRHVFTFAAALHYAAVLIDGRPMAFAYVERVKPAKDRPGRYGYAATKFGIECISGSGGTRYHVPVGALAEVVSTMETEGVHCVLFSPEPFSDTQYGRVACVAKGLLFVE